MASIDLNNFAFYVCISLYSPGVIAGEGHAFPSDTQETRCPACNKDRDVGRSANQELRVAYLPLAPRIGRMLDCPTLSKDLAHYPTTGVWRGSIMERLRKLNLFDQQNVEMVDIALAINSDGFAPLGKFSGKSTWCIYAQILNLPSHLRAKFENSLCLSVVFGTPKNFNLVCRKLIDELLWFWNDGIGTYPNCKGVCLWKYLVICLFNYSHNFPLCLCNKSCVCVCLRRTWTCEWMISIYV